MSNIRNMRARRRRKMDLTKEDLGQGLGKRREGIKIAKNIAEDPDPIL